MYPMRLDLLKFIRLNTPKLRGVKYAYHETLILADFGYERFIKDLDVTPLIPYIKSFQKNQIRRGEKIKFHRNINLNEAFLPYD